MLKGFGVIFLSLLSGAFVVVVSALMKSDFPVSYSLSDSIPVLSTILALNFATATFLVGSLLSIEERLGEDVFNDSRKEIKHNLYTMAGLLFLNIGIVSFMNLARKIEILNSGVELNNLLAILVFAILSFYVVLLLEIITAAVNLRIPRK